MIFRNHLPKQNVHNFQQDGRHATIVLQAIAARIAKNDETLRYIPDDSSREYIVKDTQECFDIIDDLTAVFIHHLPPKVVKMILQAEGVSRDV